MAKITRIFGPISGFNGNIGGSKYNNNPNGLEIVSYKDNTGGTPFGSNKSVALAIGASGRMVDEPSPGFFVSDDGKNASIGSLINYSVALNVVGTGNFTTSVTTPIVNATTINIAAGGNIAGGGSVPIYTIVMWFGSATIPPGWRLCDGGGGTPNLIDRFIIGGYASGAYGGSQSPTTGLSIGTGNLPKHTHSFTGGTFTTDWEPDHSHTLLRSNGSGGDGDSDRADADNKDDGSYTTSGAGGHNHTVNISGSIGDGGFANNALAIYKYYQLVFIMRIS
jgi:hypothetical protein